MIPFHCSGSEVIPYNKEFHKECHLVECLINRIKRFRRIVTRYGKTTNPLLSALCPCAVPIWLRASVNRT